MEKYTPENEHCMELLTIADRAVSEIEALVSAEPLRNFVLFVEICRVYDTWTCSSANLKWDGEYSRQRYDLMGYGFNLAISYFFKPLEIPGFPLAASTEESRDFAASVLYKLGCAVMIRRSVDMVRTGLLSLQRDGKSFVFRKGSEMDFQFLDQMEFSQLADVDERLDKNKGSYLEGWKLVDRERFSEVFFKTGNFHTRNNKKDFSSALISDISSVMRPLVNPLNTGKGILMGYGSSQDIEMHFMALATEIVTYWRVEAGIHPDALIGGLSGSDLSVIVMVLVSFYLKHGHFANIVSREFPEINLPMSLPIWTPMEEMIRTISELPFLEEQMVRKAFSILMLKPSETTFLKSHSTRFVPLLVDLGNGYVLRPYSAIAYNPFFSIISLLEFRNPNIRHHLSLPRENWMREELYASFSGTRYQTIEGNIKLKSGKKIVTDIDAVIFDNLTGELAIFQLKWQDFFYNDVKKLRSRASNLNRELREWALKTTDWISANGHSGLARNLRLKIKGGVPVTSVFLFGISRTKARMKGYGFSLETDNLAVCNWPQFSRNRFEVGPAEKVISRIFSNIRSQQDLPLKIKPLPVTFPIGDHSLEYPDLYNEVDNV